MYNQWRETYKTADEHAKTDGADRQVYMQEFSLRFSCSKHWCYKASRFRKKYRSYAIMYAPLCKNTVLQRLNLQLMVIHVRVTLSQNQTAKRSLFVIFQPISKLIKYLIIYIVILWPACYESRFKKEFEMSKIDFKLCTHMMLHEFFDVDQKNGYEISTVEGSSPGNIGN